MSGSAASGGEHPLTSTYTFWYQKKSANRQESWADSIKPLGDFNTVEGFWDMYNHIVRAEDVQGAADFHMFKTGIKPMWEDTSNARGGKWVMRLKKGLATHFWEMTILAILGEQLEGGDDICGAVLSIRYHEDSIAIWNRSADDADHSRISEMWSKLLSLPSSILIEYRRHDKKYHRPSSERGDTAGSTEGAAGSGDAGSSEAPHRRWRESGTRTSGFRSSFGADKEARPSWGRGAGRSGGQGGDAPSSAAGRSVEGGVHMAVGPSSGSSSGGVRGGRGRGSGEYGARRSGGRAEGTSAGGDDSRGPRSGWGNDSKPAWSRHGPGGSGGGGGSSAGGGNGGGGGSASTNASKSAGSSDRELDFRALREQGLSRQAASGSSGARSGPGSSDSGAVASAAGSDVRPSRQGGAWGSSSRDRRGGSSGGDGSGEGGGRGGSSSRPDDEWEVVTH